MPAVRNPGEVIKYPEKLQFLLEKILGSENVYFQPPSGIVMRYPCIVYQLDRVDSDYADNTPYRNAKAYQVTYIDNDPDMTIPDKIGSLPMSSFVRAFTSGNRNHYVYRLYHKEVRSNG